MRVERWIDGWIEGGREESDMMDTSCTYIEGGDRSFGKSGAVPYVFSTQDAFADVSFIMPLRCFLDPSMQALLAALPDERDSRTDLVRSTPPCSRRFRRPHRPRRPRRRHRRRRARRRSPLRAPTAPKKTGARSRSRSRRALCPDPMHICPRTNAHPTGTQKSADRTGLNVAGVLSVQKLNVPDD